MRQFTVTLTMLLCLVSTGCGVFKSSTSQASSESSSDSSSSCSPDSDEKGAFRHDVEQLTAAFVVAGGDVQQFQRDLGAIAETHGVTDWERDDDAYVAIGRGLAQAGVDRARADAFARELSASSRAARVRIAAGYSASIVR